MTLNAGCIAKSSTNRILNWSRSGGTDRARGIQPSNVDLNHLVPEFRSFRPNAGDVVLRFGVELNRVLQITERYAGATSCFHQPGSRLNSFSKSLCVLPGKRSVSVSFEIPGQQQRQATCGRNEDDGGPEAGSEPVPLAESSGDDRRRTDPQNWWTGLLRLTIEGNLAQVSPCWWRLIRLGSRSAVRTSWSHFFVAIGSKILSVRDQSKVATQGATL